MVALFTSALRDFHERRGGSRTRGDAAGDGTEGVAWNVIEASGLGKRYGGTWALRECSLAIPAGHVAALVGPNGAGKTTLLNLAVGLAAPSAGGVTVLGGLPAGSPAALDGIAFVAQDTPLYRNLSVADMLHLTRNLNRRFDQAYARSPAGRAGHPAEAEGGQAVRRPAGAARADAGAGPAAAAAGAGRAGGDARPDRPARLHGHGADGDGRRRACRWCCPRTCWPSSSGSPTTSSCCRGGGCRWPARSTTCSPATAC